MTLRLVTFLGLAGALATMASTPPVATPIPGKIDFNRDVRPILSDTCFKCHGPDASARKAKLSLHIPESAFAHRDGKPAIVPGHPDQSEAWLRLISTDPEEQMPPPKSGIKLTPQQVKILGRWIEQGAEYQPHWAFIPPKAPAIPKVSNPNW